MPLKLEWTEALDARLRRLRAEGRGWEAIAEDLGISRSTAISRGQRLGLPPVAPAPPEPDADDEFAQPDRPPLPAGHPVTWQALTAGSFLAGTSYLDLLLRDGSPHRPGFSCSQKRNKS
jgi:hypothetical protein